MSSDTRVEHLLKVTFVYIQMDNNLGTIRDIDSIAFSHLRDVTREIVSSPERDLSAMIIRLL